MSILIKDMEMPKNCEECDVKAVCKKYWELIREQYTRPSWCPLVLVPPHGRLIDADALERRTHYDDFDCLVLDASDINDAPTIIEAEEGCGRCDYCRILQTGTCRYGEENE